MNHKKNPTRIGVTRFQHLQMTFWRLCCLHSRLGASPPCGDCPLTLYSSLGTCRFASQSLLGRYGWSLTLGCWMDEVPLHWAQWIPSRVHKPTLAVPWRNSHAQLHHAMSITQLDMSTSAVVTSTNQCVSPLQSACMHTIAIVKSPLQNVGCHQRTRLFSTTSMRLLLAPSIFQTTLLVGSKRLRVTTYAGTLSFCNSDT